MKIQIKHPKHRQPTGGGGFTTDSQTLEADFPDPVVYDLGPYATKNDVLAVIKDHERRMHAPSPVPDPTPGPDPTPTPTPTPGTPPSWWSALDIRRDVQMLPSMATEADMRASFAAFLKQVPDNSRILGTPGAVYKHKGSLLLDLMAGRHDLAFAGQGAKFENTSPAMPSDTNSSSNKASSFYWHYTEKPFPHHIRFEDMVIHAGNPLAGQQNGSEFAAAIHLMGGHHHEVVSVTASGLYGDLVTVNENAQQVWVHGTHMIDCGRNSVSMVCGSHVVIEDNKFDKAGYCSFDIEPEKNSIAGNTDIVYQRNAHGLWVKNCFIAVDGANSGKPLADITIQDNTITGKSLRSVIGYSLTTEPVGARGQRIKWINNIGPDGLIEFHHIDGLTLKGTKPSWTQVSPDCTAVVVG